MRERAPWHLMTGARRPAAGLAVVMALSGLAVPAHAYRTAGATARFAGSAKVRWADQRVPYQIATDVPDGLTPDDLRETAEQAFRRWTTVVDGGIECEFETTTDQDAAPDDGINTIQFLSDGWEERGFEPAAAGITDVIYALDVTGTWTIVEADIYLNAEHHNWVAAGTATAKQRSLASVLTHEGGHLLGLMHPCEPGGPDEAPDCDEDPAFEITTMYPVYSPAQQSLSADDKAGFAFLYGVVSCDEGSCAAGSVCMTDGCHEECEGMTCAVDEHCTVGGCWPDNECYGPGCDQACQHDADCAARQRCRSNQCYGAGVVGDSCEAPSECESALCAEEGFCLASCEDCQDDSCEMAEDGTATCPSAKQPLGAECDAPEECLGGQCLTGTADGQLCTVVCAEDAGVCPSGWTCGAVRGVEVCVPIEVRAAGGGGCSLLRARYRGTAWVGACMMAAAMLALRRCRAQATGRNIV